MSGNKLPVWRIAISVGSLNIVIALESASETAAIAECRNIVGGVYKTYPIIVHRNLESLYIGDKINEDISDKL